MAKTKQTARASTGGRSADIRREQKATAAARRGSPVDYRLAEELSESSGSDDEESKMEEEEEDKDNLLIQYRDEKKELERHNTYLESRIDELLNVAKVKDDELKRLQVMVKMCSEELAILRIENSMLKETNLALKNEMKTSLDYYVNQRNIFKTCLSKRGVPDILLREGRC